MRFRLGQWKPYTLEDTKIINPVYQSDLAPVGMFDHYQGPNGVLQYRNTKVLGGEIGLNHEFDLVSQERTDHSLHVGNMTVIPGTQRARTVLVEVQVPVLGVKD